MSVPAIAWEDAPPGVSVLFSTRLGGASGGAYESLNLGALTGDDPAAVRENRRRAVEAAGGDPARATMAWQVAGAEVRTVTGEPASGVFLEPGAQPFPKSDGLVTEERGRPLVLLTADCMPIAVARTDGSRLAVLHSGWQGLLAGICEAGAEAVGGAMTAVIGPAAGPCCYEVRDDVGGPLRERFGPDVVRNGRADLWLCARRALERAGVSHVQTVGECTICNPDRYFSHRRERGRTGRQGVIGLLGA
ncbi:MAG: polyphenol oxidase family protein [Gaiellales bacterium]